MLDFTICDGARIARDPKFDGQFFTGVGTTRIYCRPVCPVRPARSKNVRFYSSAAAAEAAGFRPCLRCRPETAPFSAAWEGSRTARVQRAKRLLDDTALPMTEIAYRAGFGSLRRFNAVFAEIYRRRRARSAASASW